MKIAFLGRLGLFVGAVAGGVIGVGLGFVGGRDNNETRPTDAR